MQKTINAKRVVISTLGAVCLIWLVFGLGIVFLPVSWGVRGQLGDMFGLVNSLFSGLAFAGVILAILLQREELSLQRKELKLTRDELKKSVDAQRRSLEVLNKQAESMELAAKMNSINSLITSHSAIISSYGEVTTEAGVKDIKMRSEAIRKLQTELELLV